MRASSVHGWARKKASISRRCDRRVAGHVVCSPRLVSCRGERHATRRESGKPEVKPHRARRIAEGMRRRGATRAAANLTAVAAMDREYSPKRSGNARKAKHSFDEEAHDSRSGQRKTNLTTKEPRRAGARKVSVATKGEASKRSVKATGRTGAASTGRRARAAGDPSTRGASARQSTIGRRPPRPRKAAGARRRSGREV